MIYAYIDRKGNLRVCPADPEGEKELKDVVRRLQQNEREALDIETEMPEEQYRSYQQQRHRYGYKQGGQEFGFQPTSYMPQPPDFNPQMHMPIWPFVLPWILEGRGGDGGGGGGGASGYNRGGEYGRGYGGQNENPRDTGRGDSPNR